LGRKTFDGFSNVWTFIHEISIGDIIIANREISLIVGVGLVAGNATYTEGDNNDFRTRRAVDWKYINKNGYPIPGGKFAQATLTRISDQEIIRLVGQLLNHATEPTEQPTRVTNDPAEADRMFWEKMNPPAMAA
jgi:predicted Mrr-cat superfamily restriction endonuclease